jgi:type I restriction enzyme S subunit
MKADWIEVEIAELCELNPKLKNKESISVELEVQFLPMALVEEVANKIHLTETRKFSEVQQKSYTYFAEGDVLFAKVTPCMENGKIAIAKGLKNQIGFGSSEFHVLRPSKAIHESFLFYFLVRSKFRNEAQHEMTGAVGLRRVPKQFLENSIIPLPPLPEQRAIVARIEELMSELDHAVSSLQSAQAKLDIYRQAVLKKAFEGGFTSNPFGETELPENWRRLRLGEILKVTSGKGLTSSQMDGGKFPVYGGNGINGNHSEFLYDEPKLIIGRVGVRCGVTHITLTNSWVTDNALVVEFKKGEDQNLKFMKLKLEFENLNKLSNSTAQPVISGSKIYDYVINLPNFSEQLQIVQEIESRLSVADKLAETIQTNLQKSEALRQSILKKAFEGRLLSESEVEACRKEADWEPAERLLERIKSERSKSKKS